MFNLFNKDKPTQVAKNLWEFDKGAVRIEQEPKGGGGGRRRLGKNFYVYKKDKHGVYQPAGKSHVKTDFESAVKAALKLRSK